MRCKDLRAITGFAQLNYAGQGTKAASYSDEELCRVNARLTRARLTYGPNFTVTLRTLDPAIFPTLRRNS